MAEASTVKSAPKRRRILDPSAVVPVPIYSNQVNRSLKLKAPTFSEKNPTEEAADDGFWSTFSSKKPAAELSESDSDDELKNAVQEEEKKKSSSSSSSSEPLRSPSPPPPQSPVQKPSRKAKLKLNEIERQLQAVNSLLSPADDSRRRSRRGRRSPRLQSVDDVVIVSATEDDDLIVMSPDPPSPLGFRAERQIPLKVRCRADLHKIHVQPSTPLSVVVEQLSMTLGVPPPRLLLLREEAELSLDATVQALGLGIADIIECVVMADKVEEEEAPAVKEDDNDCSDIIKVRLQGKDRASAQEFSLHRDAPLGSVFSQYLSGLAPGAQTKVRFHFDGSKLSPQQTPAQLDMEDGDIIEVWA